MKKDYKTLKQFLIVIVTLLILSCNHTSIQYAEYSKDSTISAIDGHLNKSSNQCLPTLIKRNGIIDTTGIDSSFDQFIISTYLRVANEPVLFNFYLGHEIYRLIWLPTFDRPVIISIHKKGNDVWIESRIFSKHAPCPPPSTHIEFVAPKLDIQEEEVANIENSVDSTNKFRFDNEIPKIKLFIKRKLSLKEWSNLEKLLDDYGFYQAKPFKHVPIIDGTKWIFEAHSENGYGIVKRSIPEEKFLRCGKYMFELSGIKKYNLLKHANL